MSAQPYTISTTTQRTPDDAEQRIREALAEQGFGVLTEIDVAATLKEKLGIERPPYKILGACNPTLAAAALDIDPAIGALLPCNVIIYRTDHDTVAAAVEPLTMLGVTDNPDLEHIAREARDRLTQALHAL